MRAAFLLEPGRIELRDVPVPRPGSGELLVRVDAALTCGTDLKMYQRGHARLPLPAPFGHEFAGTVAAVGQGVDAFREGDAVACVPTAPCGECELCTRGRENLCAHAVGRMVLGAYAEYVLLPAHIVTRHVFARPDHIAAQHAAALEPLACVVHGTHRIDFTRHERVAIVGDGAIALLFARVAVLRGAEVLVLGHHEERAAIARTYGAQAVITPDNDAARKAAGEHRSSQIVECVGNPAAWRLASDLAPAGGSVLLFGGCAAGAQATFDAYRLHYEEVDMKGAFHYTPRAVTEAWELLTSGAVDPAPLITRQVPLEQLEQALAAMGRREALKVCVAGLNP
jgi:L-iditol 2-dehydrogenase